MTKQTSHKRETDVSVICLFVPRQTTIDFLKAGSSGNMDKDVDNGLHSAAFQWR